MPLTHNFFPFRPTGRRRAAPATVNRKTMKLVKIKNKYLFQSEIPEGVHTYAVYYDKESKRNRAVALTHLYRKDYKRFSQIKTGILSVEQFKEFDVPSGVWDYYYSETVDGQKINLKDHEIKKIAPRYISKKQADRIKNFAKYDYKEKLELEKKKKKKKKATAENNVTKTSKNAKQKEARK